LPTANRSTTNIHTARVAYFKSTVAISHNTLNATEMYHFATFVTMQQRPSILPVSKLRAVSEDDCYIEL